MSKTTWDIIITFAPTSFTAPKIALEVPGTPAIPVLQNIFVTKSYVTEMEERAEH